MLHPGDVLRQLERALENVEALLHSGEADLRNMTHLLVYLRDPADFRASMGACANVSPACRS